MKIQINLLSEEKSIAKNNGHFLKIFTLSEQMKRYSSKKGMAHLLINPGKLFGLTGIVLNDNKVDLEPPKSGMMQWRWNIPIKVKFNEALLNRDGYNKLEIKFNKTVNFA